jgi:hypothetical protein
MQQGRCGTVQLRRELPVPADLPLRPGLRLQRDEVALPGGRRSGASRYDRIYLQVGFLLEISTFLSVVLLFPSAAIFATRSQPHTPSPSRT